MTSSSYNGFVDDHLRSVAFHKNLVIIDLTLIEALSCTLDNTVVITASAFDYQYNFHKEEVDVASHSVTKLSAIR